LRLGSGAIRANGTIIAHRYLVITLAARYRLPAVYPWRYFVTAGALMSYGIDNVDVLQKAASYVDRILHGAKPIDLPVQAPAAWVTSDFDLAARDVQEAEAEAQRADDAMTQGFVYGWAAFFAAIRRDVPLTGLNSRRLLKVVADTGLRAWAPAAAPVRWRDTGAETWRAIRVLHREGCGCCRRLRNSPYVS
jgi:ABC transporter substrate binding protein